MFALGVVLRLDDDLRGVLGSDGGTAAGLDYPGHGEPSFAPFLLGRQKRAGSGVGEHTRVGTAQRAGRAPDAAGLQGLSYRAFTRPPRGPRAAHGNAPLGSQLRRTKRRPQWPQRPRPDWVVVSREGIAASTCSPRTASVVTLLTVVRAIYFGSGRDLVMERRSALGHPERF